MNPKVSIVIPVYNGENYMREAIESALAQSYENIEVLVVNDGSQDRTEEIALSYGSRIRYFSKENGGVSTALNLGIEQMEGEYFQYLPHDDLLHPEKIRLQIQAIQDSGSDTTIAWSGWHRLEEPTRKQTPFQIPPWYPRSHWTRGVYPLFFGLVNTVSVLIHKKCLKEAGAFNNVLRTSQDYDMWFRTFGRYGTVYVDQPLVDYRFHALQGTQADEAFEKNCRDLAWNMLRAMTKTEIEKAFFSEFIYYFSLLKYYREVGWKDCYAYALKRFMELEEPDGEKRKRRQFRENLLGGGRLVLYGAGKNGRRLLNELRMYGIPVSAFCDGDPSQHGTEFDGVSCISKDRLLAAYGKEATVLLVTIDRPELVKAEFLSLGYRRVTDYSQIAEKLAEIYPNKEMVLSNIQGEG